MKVKVKDRELELYYSMRIYIIYENVTGASLGEINPNSLTSTASLIYAALMATYKHNNINDTLTYDDVIEVIDANGGMVFVNKFSEWFIGKVNAETELIAKQAEAIEDVDKKN